MPTPPPPAATGPLAGLEVCLVGPGRVGRSLADWVLARGARVRAIGVRGGPSLPADGIDAPRVPWRDLDSAGCDLLLLSVPTDRLGEVAADLARRPQAAVSLHVAGSCGAGAIAALRRSGSAIGSLHPLLAFASPLPVERARGAFFAVDGDPPASALARRLVAAWDGRWATVDEAMRPLYHLAATLAAGGATTVTAAALGLARDLGLPTAAAEGLLDLGRGALARQDAAAPAGAITGPAARGEEGYADQLALLEERWPELRRFATALAEETIRQADAADPGGAPRRRRLLARLRATPSG